MAVFTILVVSGLFVGGIVGLFLLIASCRNPSEDESNPILKKIHIEYYTDDRVSDAYIYNNYQSKRVNG